MSKKNMTAYLEETGRLRIKYKDKIEIYTGLEIDYLDETYNASTEYFQKLPLDYRIGSVHFLPVGSPLLEENMSCIDGPYSEFENSLRNYYNNDIKLFVKHYFDNSKKMVEAGGFDIVGHIDKIYMNASNNPDFDIHAGWFRKPFLELLDLVAEKGFIIEINTKNKVRKNYTYPYIDSFTEILKRNIPIMVNADTHLKNLVYSGIEETLHILKETGFRTTRELAEGKWQDIEI
jgi:histidinol-phosphatase (PHP family)